MLETYISHKIVTELGARPAILFGVMYELSENCICKASTTRLGKEVGHHWRVVQADINRLTELGAVRSVYNNTLKRLVYRLNKNYFPNP